MTAEFVDQVARRRAWVVAGPVTVQANVPEVGEVVVKLATGSNALVEALLSLPTLEIAERVE